MGQESGHDVSIKLSPLGGGGGWVQTVGCRLRLGDGERLPWQGAGWEQRLLAPRQLQIIPRHKQPSGGLWLCWARRPWPMWEEERHLVPAASVCPEQSPPSWSTPLSEMHTPCTCTCTGPHGGEAAEGDGGSRWQLRV